MEIRDQKGRKTAAAVVVFFLRMDGCMEKAEMLPGRN